MDANTYCAYNKTRQSFLCAEATAVDSVLDPLRVLKVLIEGLDPDTETALYLQRFSGVPVAGTLSAFDLVYLDRNNRVIHGVALSPDYEAMPFRGRAEAALVLPSGSIASSRTSRGDELIITVVREAESEPELTSIAAAAEQGELIAEPAPQASAGDELIFTVDEETESQPEPAPLAAIPEEAEESAEPALQARSNDELIFVVADEAVRLSEPVPISSADEEAADETGPAAEPLPDQSGIESLAAGEGIVEQQPALQQLDAKEETGAAAEQDSLEDELRRLVAGKPVKKEVKGSPDQWDSMEAELRRSIAQRENRLKHIRIWTSAPPNRPPALKDALKAPFLSSADWVGNEPGSASGAQAGAADQKPEAPARKESMRIRLLRRIDYFLRWIDYAENEPVEIEEEEDPDQRRGQRLSFPNMVAFCWTGGLPKPFKVGNISVSGFYLITDDRWSPGTILKMTLQSSNATGENPRDAITVHARVVRLGPDGEGFEFVLTKLLE